MKLNVILVFRAINSIKLQGIHFYIIDISVSGNEGVNIIFEPVFAFAQLHDCPCTVYFGKDEVFIRNEIEPVYTHPNNETCGVYVNKDENRNRLQMKII